MTEATGMIGGWMVPLFLELECTLFCSYSPPLQVPPPLALLILLPSSSTQPRALSVSLHLVSCCHPTTPATAVFHQILGIPD